VKDIVNDIILDKGINKTISLLDKSELKHIQEFNNNKPIEEAAIEYIPIKYTIKDGIKYIEEFEIISLSPIKMNEVF
jgi:hypothetical protein